MAAIALIPPPVPSEFASTDATHNSDCGPCLVAGIARAFGINIDCHDVAQYLRDSGRPTYPGTFANDLAYAIQHFCSASCAAETGIDLGDLDRGHYAIRLVQSDGNGHPVPRGQARVTHWIGYWGRDGDTIYVANPGPGSNSERYSIEYLQACDLGVGLEILRDARPGGLLDLFDELRRRNVFKDDDDAKNWLCWLTWQLTLRRPYDEGNNAAWRNILDTEGAFRLAQILSSSPEATGRSAQIGHLLDQYPTS